ncbi:MBL fold metallo-hydrolase [Methanobacterium alcaliphilum]|uniref:MBL fold metallo-hydrolase n=1 Tax=Methanobacterium alcaliphilum TaxID=392018 RepID=UPI00200A44F6|nr:MBL fold metallo-hydrolase [Methanobacterium alcaliphilum]MCK9151510.1 MBL fold metallo-hydrolase [Methanobacterium alcaliphilum]
MKLVPLAFESFGVRSMCTYVETDQKILIDPGTSIAPKRFKLPPSTEEIITLKQSRYQIAKYGGLADIITISHYHHDHFTPFEENRFLESSHDSALGIYNGKKIFLKDPNNHINKNQEKRARKLLSDLQKIPCEIEFSDGKDFQIGDTQLKFSPALAHGKENSPLGYVVAVSILYKNEKLMHASDIQGPISDKALKYVLREDPDILILSGPPLYLLRYALSKEDYEKSKEHLKHLSDNIPKIILDHHLLRTKRGLKLINELNENNNLISASQFCGEEPLLLESQRKKLHLK